MKKRGFWDGGSAGHGSGAESSGRARGYPGRREITKTGVQTDLTKPAPSAKRKKKSDKSSR